MVRNEEFLIAGIKNLMRTNYGLNGSELDLYAEVDRKLSMRENWFILKPKILLLCQKEHKLLFN